MSDTKFTFVDLFSGIGGFHMAFSRNGGECVGFSEINNDAIESYCFNYNIDKKNNLGDITKIKDLPSHDLLSAGVPCQSWSIAGKNLGFDDDRGQLWNDTIFLLNRSKPKAFIFENVKGLVDPRNSNALDYILNRIRQAGYFAKHYLVNSYDYGLLQNRIRVFIIGFKDEEYFQKFEIKKPLINERLRLGHILEDFNGSLDYNESIQSIDLFGNLITDKKMSLSMSNGFNDYFLFNDIRNGHSTVHSWDIIDSNEKQRRILNILLKNRRKSEYGVLDGNAMSFLHLNEIDSSISQEEIDQLVGLGILKEVNYSYKIIVDNIAELNENEKLVLDYSDFDLLVIDKIKNQKKLKINKIPVNEVIQSLLDRNKIELFEKRYDFVNSKISTGINGINRIFLPSSKTFSTLVASDTNDFVTTKIISANNEDDFKKKFIDLVYKKGEYRKITKEEALEIQGFPKTFVLPDSRSRWMKLIGNSVSVPVINYLIKDVISTGVFD